MFQILDTETQIEKTAYPGDYVKLRFRGNGATERMWVMVTSTPKGGIIEGELRNVPAIVPMEYGDVIRFTRRNIVELQDPEQDEIISSWINPRYPN